MGEVLTTTLPPKTTQISRTSLQWVVSHTMDTSAKISCFSREVLWALERDKSPLESLFCSHLPLGTQPRLMSSSSILHLKSVMVSTRPLPRRTSSLVLLLPSKRPPPEY